MKKSYLYVLKIVLALFIISYLFMQVYNAFYNPFTTESATYYSTYEGVSMTGISVRNESVLTDDINGVKSYLPANGQRVSKDSVIAKVYNSTDEASAAGRIAEIDSQIQELQSLGDSKDTTAADLNSLESKIYEGYINVLSCENGNAFVRVNDLSAELLTLLNKKQIAIGKSSDFNALIASLESEKDSLGSGIQSIGEITTPNSGYFVNEVDGLESELTTDIADTLTPETLNQIMGKAVSQPNAAGKVVDDYQWYIAANVSIDDSAKFTEDSDIILKTDLATMQELPVTVVKINPSASGDQATIIFRCKYINGELAAIRSQPLTAVLQSYSGLRIGSKSIRVVDGKQGVYVLSGSAAKFKTVDIVYTSGGYTICSMDNTDSNALSLYDEVIVKGKNLYDGKIIK